MVLFVCTGSLRKNADNCSSCRLSDSLIKDIQPKTQKKQWIKNVAALRKAIPTQEFQSKNECLSNDSSSCKHACRAPCISPCETSPHTLYGTQKTDTVSLTNALWSYLKKIHEQESVLSSCVCQRWASFTPHMRHARHWISWKYVWNKLSGSWWKKKLLEARTHHKQEKLFSRTKKITLHERKAEIVLFSKLFPGCESITTIIVLQEAHRLSHRGYHDQTQDTTFTTIQTRR